MITNERPPVANRSGLNGDDGPCENMVECACIGLVRDAETGEPTHLVFEGVDGGPPTTCPIKVDIPKAGPTQVIDPASPPEGVTFADPDNPTLDELAAAAAVLGEGQPAGTLIVYGDAPNQWVWYVDGAGDEQVIKCPAGPTQVIDPASPPEGVTFADPDNPTAAELAAAAAVLLAGQPAGTKAKYGDEPCQWVYEIDVAGDVCLLQRPFVPVGARLRHPNLSLIAGNIDADSAVGVPLGYGVPVLEFETFCKQDISITGYYHLRYYGPVFNATVLQGRSLMIFDGAPQPYPPGNAEIFVVTGGTNGQDFSFSFNHVIADVQPGVHTLSFDLVASGPALSGSIQPNQMTFMITNLHEGL